MPKRKTTKRIPVAWKRKRRKLKILFVLVFSVILITGFFAIRNKWFAIGEVDAKKVIPNFYNESLEVSLGKNKLTVTPMAGNPVKVVQKDVRYIYEEAYKNTTVVQTNYPYRIKEELIFSAPGHPLEFKYKLGNVDKFIVEKDDKGNIGFYDKQRHSIDKELSRIFTILTPFIEDKNRRSFEDVKGIVQGDILIITISPEWLEKASYPVILDPTIEISVLNVYSHVVAEDNWEIEFIAKGSANLKITPDNPSTVENCEFKSLFCDQEERVPQILEGNIIYYQNWECSGTGKIIYKVLKTGNQTLHFEFGDAEAYTYGIKRDIRVKPLQIGKKQIDFPYGDDNSNETLIIQTDNKVYDGLSRAEVYFSVTNINDQDELIDLAVYFPKEMGEVKKIEKWQENVPYQANIPDYGSMEHRCNEAWEKFTPEPDIEIYAYRCKNTNEVVDCSSLSPNGRICRRENINVGFHKETRYKNDWLEITNPNVLLSVIKSSSRKKSVSSEFKIKRTTAGQGSLIVAGETQYFRMEIQFPVGGSGEFYVEAMGDKNGYGLLDPWFNSSWNYRKRLTINGTSAGAQSNYQMDIAVNYGSGLDKEEHVYCGNNCKSDFGDIRFTASNGETELDYWIASYTAGSVATISVEIDSIPASPGATEIYMYYGNSGASTTGNGGNTFGFFDDFSGDLSKWTVDAANTDAIEITATLGNPSPSLRQDPDTSQSRNSYFDTRMITSSYTMQNGIIEYDLYLSGTSSSAPRIIHQFGARVDSLSFTNGYAWRMQNSSADGGWMEFGGGAWAKIGLNWGPTTGNTWNSVKMVVSGTTYDAYVNKGTVSSATDTTKQTADYLISHVHGVSLAKPTSYILLDNIRVRNYASPQPTFGSWNGEEQTPSDPNLIRIKGNTRIKGGTRLNLEDSGKKL